MPIRHVKRRFYPTPSGLKAVANLNSRGFTPGSPVGPLRGPAGTNRVEIPNGKAETAWIATLKGSDRTAQGETLGKLICP